MKLKDAGIYDLINIFKGVSSDLHNRSQGEMINQEPRFINIPAYQRPYRWAEDLSTENNIDKLFEDYDDNNNEYFLGSAVVVQRANQNNELEYDVIDGQQRITTLYLLNYIRFLLMKELYLNKLNQRQFLKLAKFCDELKDTYVGLIGKNTVPFDNLESKIDEFETITDEDEKARKIVECFKKELCIPEEKSTEEESLKERCDKAEEFFRNEKLCLKYSRDRYNKTLKEALQSVYLLPNSRTNKLEIQIINSQSDVHFLKNYQNALVKLFNKVWDRAQKEDPNADRWFIAEKAIEFSKDMINNLSLCVVVTENKDDANKLFEVLNDRSLEVEDLELIKNHFYEEYCTKSNDSEDEKDKVITELDELWTDTIFEQPELNKNKLISYLAAIYLTKDKDILYKDDTKLKKAINEKYSKIHYSNRPYSKDDIVRDFNIYYAVKIILDKFDYKMNKQNQASLKAENSEYSISYKAFHLINATKYNAVLPALVNVIISNYKYLGNSLTDENFGDNFSNYITDILNDKEHDKEKYMKIHKCAYMLWIATIKSKDFEIPRRIARKIIEKYGLNSYDENNMDFEHQDVKDLDEELAEWLSTWNFSSSKTHAIKVLLLNLLKTSRDPKSKGYKEKEVTVKLDVALTYTLHSEKIQLDHLEANKIVDIAKEKYYSYDNLDKRKRYVNGYVGNFMILDFKDNNDKNNKPLAEAISYYDKMDPSWLVDDIKEMIKDKKYFDLNNKVPKDEFFIERSNQLNAYFKSFLNKDLKQKEIIVKLK